MADKIHLTNNIPGDAVVRYALVSADIVRFHVENNQSALRLVRSQVLAFHGVFHDIVQPGHLFVDKKSEVNDPT